MFITAILLVYILPQVFTSNLTLDFEQRSGYGKYFTNTNGRITDNILDSISLGKYGPISFYDRNFLEQITHFNRERISPRVVASIGAGAFGYFECTNPDAPKWTKASLFAKPGKITKLVTRFAINVGERNFENNFVFTDFTQKYYTDEGNLDLLGTSSVVFPIRDPTTFHDLARNFNSQPRNFLMNIQGLFDWFSLLPEAIHSLTIFNDYQILKNGFQSTNPFVQNTYRFVNAKGDYTYVRFRSVPLQVKKPFNFGQSVWIRGHIPDYNSRELVRAIRSGNYPKWLLQVQLMSPQQAEKVYFNPFDPTKFWPEKEFPPITLGKIVLNKLLDNFFTQNTMLKFDANHLVPGIEMSLDRLLQGRFFAYQDAQNYRLGVNSDQFEVNRPRSPRNTPTIRDGHCATYLNNNPDPDYYPNSFGKTNKFGNNDLVFKLPEVELKRWDVHWDDNYYQTNLTWKSYTDAQQDELVYNLNTQFVFVKDKGVKDRFFKQLKKINYDYYEKMKNTYKNVTQTLQNGSPCFCDKKFLRQFNLKYIRADLKYKS